MDYILWSWLFHFIEIFRGCIKVRPSTPSGQNKKQKTFKIGFDKPGICKNSKIRWFRSHMCSALIYLDVLVNLRTPSASCPKLILIFLRTQRCKVPKIVGKRFILANLLSLARTLHRGGIKSCLLIKTGHGVLKHSTIISIHDGKGTYQRPYLLTS